MSYRVDGETNKQTNKNNLGLGLILKTVLS